MREWKEHVGAFAWPTVALAAALAAATVAIGAAGAARIVPLWLAGAALVPIAYLWFTPLHEAVHGNIGGIKRRAWVDGLVGWTAALAFVAPYPAFKAVHLRHHGTVNRTGVDPDLWVRGATPIAVALRCLTIVPHYYAKLFEMSHESAALRTALLQSAATVVVFVGAAAALVATGHAAELFALWLVPGWLASGLLAFAFDWLPHHPHDGTGRFDNARILEGGPLLTALLVAQDAHLVHHLWPRVPFYRYHRVLAATRSALVARGVQFTAVDRATILPHPARSP